MTRAELEDVLNRYPELQVGLPEHTSEVVRLAARILKTETRPPEAPVLAADAPGWERHWWVQRCPHNAKRLERHRVLAVLLQPHASLLGVTGEPTR